VHLCAVGPAPVDTPSRPTWKVGAEAPPCPPVLACHSICSGCSIICGTAHAAVQHAERERVVRWLRSRNVLSYGALSFLVVA
jgi:hypothetical protein